MSAMAVWDDTGAVQRDDFVMEENITPYPLACTSSPRYGPQLASRAGAGLKASAGGIRKIVGASAEGVKYAAGVGVDGVKYGAGAVWEMGGAGVQKVRESIR